jgi:hypothetical protein
MPYVVFAEELEGRKDLASHTVETLEQAFAQITCRCGLNYHFEQEQEGWRLVFVDVERPECSPEPIKTDYRRPRDAKHDLIAQAVDGRLRGHLAVNLNDFQSTSASAEGNRQRA